MKRKKSFSLTNPSEAFVWLLVIVILSIGVIVMSLLLTDESPIAMCTIFSLIVFIPCGWAMLWIKVTKITVDGDTITVRKWTGRKYSFNIHDVTCVQWNITDNGMGRFEGIAMKIGKKKKLNAGMLMRGFEKLAAYVEANVDESKIHYTIKN